MKHIKITVHLIILMSAFFFHNCTGVPVIQALNHYTGEELYPYLEKNGYYGYVNKDLEFVIAAKYSTATLFTTTGFAVVSEVPKPLHMHRNYYGVINQAGELVVPYVYEEIHLEVLNGQTLIWTNHAYRNRWRFWEWSGILFGDNFLSDAKLIDTEVWRSKMQFSVLESGQHINKKRTYERARLLESLPFEAIDSLTFLQVDQLYQLQEGKAICIAKNIYGKTMNGFFLQKQGNNYRLIDRNGNSVLDTSYKKRKNLRIRMDGRELLFPVENIEKIKTENGTGQLRYFFQDNQGRQYIFPNFGAPFPDRVDALAEGNIAMDTVLNRSRLYPDTSRSGRHYFRWNYMLDEQRNFETDESGIWKRYASAQFDPTKKRHPGDKNVVPDNHIPQGWQLADQEVVNDSIYCITIEKGERNRLEKRMGLWNISTGSWEWEPVNYTISPLDVKKKYWKYQEERMGKYGLYNTSIFQQTTPLLYDEVFQNGFVQIRNSVSSQVDFYVNWETGKAYCDSVYLKE